MARQIVPADPGHLEGSSLDQDAADGAEQVPRGAHPEERLVDLDQGGVEAVHPGELDPRPHLLRPVPGHHDPDRPTAERPGSPLSRGREPRAVLPERRALEPSIALRPDAPRERRARLLGDELRAEPADHLPRAVPVHPLQPAVAGDENASVADRDPLGRGVREDPEEFLGLAPPEGPVARAATLGPRPGSVRAQLAAPPEDRPSRAPYPSFARSLGAWGWECRPASRRLGLSREMPRIDRTAAAESTPGRRPQDGPRRRPGRRGTAAGECRPYSGRASAGADPPRRR